MKSLFTASAILLALMASLAMGTTCRAVYDTVVVCDSSTTVTRNVCDSVWVPGDTQAVCTDRVIPAHNDTVYRTVVDSQYSCTVRWDTLNSHIDTVCGFKLVTTRIPSIVAVPAETVTTCTRPTTGHYDLVCRTVRDTVRGGCRATLRVVDTVCTADATYPVYGTYVDTSTGRNIVPMVYDTVTRTVLRLTTTAPLSGYNTVTVAPVRVDSANVSGARGYAAVEVTLSASLASVLDTSRISFSYAGMDLRGVPLDSLRIYYKNGTKWECVGGRLDTYTQTVYANVTHFSTYGLFGNLSGTAVEKAVQKAPFALSVNPNPFHPATTVLFSLDAASSVKVNVYNLRGEKVRSLAAGSFSAGSHTVAWNGKDETGRTLSSGMYLVRLQAGHKVLIQKVGFVR